MLILPAYTFGTLFLNILIVDLNGHSMSSMHYHKKEKILKHIRVFLAIQYIILGLVSQVLISSHIASLRIGYAFNFDYAFLLFIWVVMFWIQISFLVYHMAGLKYDKISVKKGVPFAKKEYMTGNYYLVIANGIEFNRNSFLNALDFCYGECELAKPATAIGLFLSACSFIAVLI